MGKSEHLPFSLNWSTWLSLHAGSASLKKYGLLSLLLFFTYQGLAWGFYQLNEQQGLLELGCAPHFLQSPIGALSIEGAISLRQSLTVWTLIFHGVLSLFRLVPVLTFGVWLSMGLTYFFGVRLLAPKMNRLLLVFPAFYVVSEILQTIIAFWILILPEIELGKGVAWFNLFQRFSLWLGFASLGLVLIGWLLWRIFEFILHHTP
ncbi:hypothetical protein [Anaerolinea sp.]|uniref:hypothetical protein n=1 Tax=Anaerolinea sp. TaxID=1872519 RepID=UPI002ACD5BFE|nr:hypothetical protein [Anaerolinea sp.]